MTPDMFECLFFLGVAILLNPGDAPEEQLGVRYVGSAAVTFYCFARSVYLYFTVISTI